MVIIIRSSVSCIVVVLCVSYSTNKKTLKVKPGHNLSPWSSTPARFE